MDRRSTILQLINEADRVEVTELATRLGVSQVTIRKDLNQLQSQGLIRREHGFAEAMAPDNLLSRLAVHFDAKQRIAQAAAQLVDDGDTVMIESGSCCALLATELAKRHAITIVTNSTFIADYVRDGTARVVLLGGDYEPEAQVTVGPLVAQCAKVFHAKRLFIGVDGYADGEFSGKDLARAAAVRAMAGRCDTTVVLSESSKFERAGSVSLLPTAAVATVVTDDGIAPATKQALVAAGITVTLTSHEGDT